MYKVNYRAQLLCAETEGTKAFTQNPTSLAALTAAVILHSLNFSEIAV